MTGGPSDRSLPATPGTDVVEAYARPSLSGAARWDEMVDPASGVREAWGGLGSALRSLGTAGLAEQRRSVSATLTQQGVTYRPAGGSRERPWGLDPVPLLVAERDWRSLDEALVQRTRLLDAVLSDLYGARRLLTEGLLPAQIVFGHAGFVRDADGIRLPGPRQLFLSATDVARRADGSWVALADRTQAPTGGGYAMVNRQAVSRSLAGLFRDTGVQRLAPFFQAMRLSLQALAPEDVEVPRIVLLTAGPGSETAFDQANLAGLLGFPLVQGDDLVVRDGQVWQRSIGRLERVDVIVRRVDADLCDPLELRPESQLGVPGLLEACRLGTVSVVNGPGTGVLENPGLFPFLPRIAQVLLGEELLMPSAPTWWCGDPVSRRHVLAGLSRLVVKPIARGARVASLFGGALSSDARDLLARRIEAEPWAWVGQEPVEASTAPAVGGAGLQARPITLRSFAVAHADSYLLLPGGLGRVDPPLREPEPGRRGTSKDVWVLTGAPPAGTEPAPPPARGRVGTAVSPRVAETLFELGRYAERAEDVSRLVAVTASLWRDVHAGADPALRAAMEVLVKATVRITAVQPPLPDGAPVHRQLATLIGDASRTGTVVHDVRVLLDLAVASRDQLSVDTWTVLGGLEELLAPFGPQAAAGGAPDVQAAMATLRSSLMAFAGLAQESMVRDAGWHFLDAGRRLERGLQIVRLLRSTLGQLRGDVVDAVVQEHTLFAAESLVTHRRRYPARSDTATVVELLLLDRDNPRALAFQLDRLAADLRHVGPDDALADLVAPLGRTLAGHTARELAAVHDGGRRTVLTGLLDRSLEQLHGLAAAVDRAHFDHGRLRRLGGDAR